MLTEGRHLVEDYEKAFSALSKLAEIVRLAQAGGVTSTILVDLGFARGLEYYTGLVFEVFTPRLGIALGGGGRYDRLVELFGGEPTPAVGFSPGIDRIVLAMQQAHLFAGSEVVPPRVLIIPVGEQSKEKVLKVAADLRTHGISTQIEISGRSITPALAFADKKGYPFILILGARELEKGSIIVRDMHKKTQKEVPISSLIDELQQTL
jgi:histidyl-tRNA synthetase